MKSLRSIPALCAFFVVAALIVAGCGSSSSSSSAGGGTVPSGDAAVVAGNPITKRAVLHWMYVDAKGQAAQSPGAPVIVPTDPPDFPKCIAQVKKEIPTLAKETDAKIRTACQSAFTSYCPGGHGIPDHRVLVSGDGAQARDQPDRRAAAAGDHEGQDPVRDQDRRRLQAISDHLRLHRRRHRVPDPGLDDLQQAAQAPPDGRLHRGHRQLLRGPQVQLRLRREAQPPDRARQDAGQRQRRQGGAEEWPELGRGRQEVLDRPDHEGHRRAADRASPPSRRTQRSPRRRSRLRSTSSRVPSRASSATTCSRS